MFCGCLNNNYLLWRFFITVTNFYFLFHLCILTFIINVLLNRCTSLCTLTVVAALLYTLAFIFDVTMRALAVIERLVAAANKFAIRIDRTGKAAWNRWLDWWRNIWLDWCRNRRLVFERDTFVFMERFVVSIVACAIMKAVIAPFVREAVRVDGTLVVTVTPEEKTRFLKREIVEVIVSCVSFGVVGRLLSKNLLGLLGRLLGRHRRLPRQLIASKRHKWRWWIWWETFSFFLWWWLRAWGCFCVVTKNILWDCAMKSPSKTLHSIHFLHGLWYVCDCIWFFSVPSSYKVGIQMVYFTFFSHSRYVCSLL